MHFPRFRIFTWIILAINALFLVWIIVGAASRPAATNTTCNSLDLQTCQAASDVGTAIGVGLIIGLWVAADVILGILWLITKPKTRDCPACGRAVKRGKLNCKGCGYDFTQAQPVVQNQPKPPLSPTSQP